MYTAVNIEVQDVAAAYGSQSCCCCTYHAYCSPFCDIWQLYHSLPAFEPADICTSADTALCNPIVTTRREPPLALAGESRSKQNRHCALVRAWHQALTLQPLPLSHMKTSTQYTFCTGSRTLSGISKMIQRISHPAQSLLGWWQAKIKWATILMQTIREITRSNSISRVRQF